MSTNQTQNNHGKGVKLQDPEADVKPRISGDQVSDVIYRLYGMEASDIKTFPSYDDLNFFFQVRDPCDNPHITEVNQHGYVLKVLNSLQSKDPTIIDAQDAFRSYLRGRGIYTQKPVLNKQGTRWSLETFQGSDTGVKNGPYVVWILKFIPGDVFLNTPYVNGSFYNVGRFIGRLREAAKGFHHPFYDSYTNIWSLEQIPAMRNFLSVVTDPYDVQIVNGVIDAFEKEVTPLFEKLIKGTIHGDLNDQNLIMHEVRGQERVPKDARVHDVTAAIDFSDATQSYNVIDVAVCIAHLSIECPEERQLDVGGHIVAGYLKESSLNEEEMSCLKTLVCARLCQSLVFGANSYMLQPENVYLMMTSEKGWPLLRKLWKTGRDELLARWKSIFSQYNDGC